MTAELDVQKLLTRRHFFGRLSTGLGTAALASILKPDIFAAADAGGASPAGVLPGVHFTPKVRRVIYMFMSGGPSHIDLLDYKPQLRQHHGEELPASIRMGQRLTGMTSG